MRNSIIIMLIDHDSISEKIIIKSFKNLLTSKFNFIFIGNIYFFKKIKKKIFVTKYLNKKILRKRIIFYDLDSINLSNDKYINKITDKTIELLKNKIATAVINMPINKKKYFQNKFFGFTEFFAKKISKNTNENMLLFNEHISVLPLTTHVKIKDVSKFITKKKLKMAVINLNNFYKKIIKKKVNIKILGLNPHAGIDFVEKTEEQKTILPTIKKLKLGIYNIAGPFSADTAFIKKKGEQNLVIIGMYHDQVLPVFKTLCNYNGANITIGTKYIRLSPDHGTGRDLIKKNINNINNKSFLYCLKFCEKYIKS